MDQRIGFYTSKAKSRKWSMVAFSYILDTARVNASTLFALNKKTDPLKQNSFEFGMAIVFSLVGPYIQNRDQARLNPGIKENISITLRSMKLRNPAEKPKTPAGFLGPSQGEKRKRCATCVEELPPGKNQNSISSVRMLCQVCGSNICKSHVIQICVSCSDSR